MPARPENVSGSAPSASPRRAISARPRVMRAALALSPYPRPSPIPVAMAMMFFTALASSTPTRSGSRRHGRCRCTAVAAARLAKPWSCGGDHGGRRADPAPPLRRDWGPASTATWDEAPPSTPSSTWLNRCGVSRFHALGETEDAHACRQSPRRAGLHHIGVALAGHGHDHQVDAGEVVVRLERIQVGGNGELAQVVWVARLGPHGLRLLRPAGQQGGPHPGGRDGAQWRYPSCPRPPRPPHRFARSGGPGRPWW